MSPIAFNDEHKKALDAILLPLPGVRAAKAFGVPAYYVGKKMFACVYEDGVSVKLPEETVQSLLDGKIYVPFVPMAGRKMREWVQICRTDSSEYLADMNLFVMSIEFVSQNV
jgi:hypothetical protein